jgi:hypothetical protein
MCKGKINKRAHINEKMKYYTVEELKVEIRLFGKYEIT